jgi:two-component system, NtrC family, sensor kinase
VNVKAAFTIALQIKISGRAVKSVVIILFLALSEGVCYPLDTTARLSRTMFNNNQQIYLSDLPGWIFKTGHDPDWANSEIDITGWQPLRPSDLSIKYADTNGRLEGWFRIKITLDSTLKNFGLGLRRGTWASTDIFVDGKLFASYGNRGDDRQTYREYNPIDKFSSPINLEVDREHLISIHFVDYTTLLYPERLKSDSRGGTFVETNEGLRSLLMLTGPEFNSQLSDSSKERLQYRTIWVSVTSLLSLLFWLLAFQNPYERTTLSLIAIFSTFTAIQNLARFFFTDPDVTFITFRIADLLFKLSYWAILIMLLVVVSSVLKSKITRPFRIGLIAVCIIAILTVNSRFVFPLLYTGGAASFCFLLYILIFSRQKIKGAQWTIVVGLSLTAFFSLITSIAFKAGISSFLLMTCFYFSLPLSLLVYVSWRFKEVFHEIHEKAEQVLQMTEEKREQALNQQKILEEEVARQTAELRTTLGNLRSTQSQLIQSEKMASLGELTAGIAHEIQNPLNFVNNFSEVSNELLAEMKEEMQKGNYSEAQTITDNVKQNLEKILHHGKRADGIVKGMLQHSRSSSGIKEPTDINALVDEYLRLAYHGYRAKDKTFNALATTELDKSVGKVNVVPQDISRVVLNLITNAFYAVTEKQKHAAGEYQPAVSVTTKRQDGCVLISVKDNGNGIPPKVLDKIFQPFFTTKPTGQGTGLGLSLSYDIVKAHGGEMKVENQEGSGVEFIIILSLSAI